MKLAKSVFMGLVFGLVSYPALANESVLHTVTLTGSEISSLATISAIDSTEILLGVVAKNKKSNADVNDLANMMIDQHGANLTQILDMLKAANQHKLDGEKAKHLASAGKKALITLGGLQGAQFDKAYVAAMVTGHQEALTLIDTQLMKTATSDEMKKFLMDTRAAVAHHLETAKKLQEKMAS